MRILTGKYKGRQILSSKDHSIRPTTNKIKEYIFELLGGFVKDAFVLDLFSGSGSLGIEAMSRGAKEVTFVDNSKRSLDVLRKNLNAIAVEEPYRIIRKDAMLFLKRNSVSYDLIFADPPFKWNLFNDMLVLAFKPENISEKGIFVIESEKSHAIEWNDKNFKVLRQKTFDRSVITFLSRDNTI